MTKHLRVRTNRTLFFWIIQFKNMSLKEIVSVALILFSIIDILGNLPIIISLKQRGLKIKAFEATVAAGLIMIVFLFIGELILSLFGVDVSSFAVAGAIVIFIIGLEMILGVHFFKMDSELTSGSFFPVAFPLLAGAGTLTAILSLKAEYQLINIISGILINLIIIFFVIRSSNFIKKKLGLAGAEILRKVFGIVLLAIAIKLFKTNIQFIS